MAKATEQTTVDTSTTETTPAPAAPAPAPAPKAPKATAHPWDAYEDTINGLTRYNGKARGE